MNCINQNGDSKTNYVITMYLFITPGEHILVGTLFRAPNTWENCNGIKIFLRQKKLCYDDDLE